MISSRPSCPRKSVSSPTAAARQPNSFCTKAGWTTFSSGLIDLAIGEGVAELRQGAGLYDVRAYDGPFGLTIAQPNVISPLPQRIGKVNAFCTTAPGAIAAYSAGNCARSPSLQITTAPRARSADRSNH